MLRFLTVYSFLLCTNREKFHRMKWEKYYLEGNCSLSDGVRLAADAWHLVHVKVRKHENRPISIIIDPHEYKKITLRWPIKNTPTLFLLNMFIRGHPDHIMFSEESMIGLPLKIQGKLSPGCWVYETTKSARLRRRRNNYIRITKMGLHSHHWTFATTKKHSVTGEQILYG